MNHHRDIGRLYTRIYEKTTERYTPDRIPFRTERAYSGRGGKKLKVATAVAYRSHQAIPEDQGIEFSNILDPAEKRKQKNIIANIVRPIERKYLTHWAEQVGLMMDNDLFEKTWREQGEMGGAESNVYFDEESQRWFKRNNVSYHSSYLEFFYRLALHNEMFPEKPVALEGFVINDGNLEVVLSQPHARAERGASDEEIEEFMANLGYYKIPYDDKVNTQRGDYYNKEKGIRIEDMHDENVLVDGEGNFFVIDPVIYLDDDGKRGRISSEEPLEFELP